MPPLTVRRAVCKYILFFIFVFNCSFAFAQLNADFTADKTGGCSPLTVSFTNKTTGASANVTYQWDLGNGNTSTNINPGATYKEEKTYTVTLTAKDGSQTSTKTFQFTVYKKPTVDFSASIVKGCLPLPVNFSSSSTAGDGTLASYFWDFGDGTTQKVTTGQINHVFNFAQKASVSLTVTNSYGCFNTFQKPDLVEVLPGIKPVFTPDKTTLCAITDAVKFTNTSTGPADITYAWDFGDGNTSTTQSPSYTYNKKGTFPVKLTVTSASGCSASASSTINIANFTSDFDVPAPLCQNTQLTFTNKSSPIPSSSTWMIDNNYYSSYSNTLTNTFYTPGSHTIKLTNTYGTCQDVVTKPIIIKDAPVLNGFIANLGGACGAPVTVQFKDTSATAVKWLWNFYGYGQSTSTAKEPSFTYTAESYYSVQLTITNADGCTATRSQTVNTTKPNIYVSIIKSSSNNTNYGCSLLTATFAATPAADIADYNWDFGDGTTANTAQPQHTFSKPGNYQVRLSYTTNSGCKGTTTYYAVTVYQKPSVDFTASSTTICGNTPVVFTITSNNNNYGSNAYWQFGDNSSYYTYYSNYNSATYQYNKDSVYTVSLIVSNNGCADTVTKKNYITVLPPFPKISLVTNTCNDTRGLVTFTDGSKKATGGTWDFGDGSTSTYSPGQPGSHVFTKTGTYKVALTATNGSCSVRDSTTAYVLLKQSPKLTATSSEICGSDKLNITVNNFEVNPYPYYYSYYSYNVDKVVYGDGTTFTGINSNTNYNGSTTYISTLSQFAAGQKDIKIISRSYYFNCYDTTNYVPLKIKGPIVKFAVTQNNVCYKTPTIFSDSSKGTNSVPIKQWDWTYGDGITESFTNGNNTPHIYNNPGVFYPTLKVTDADGCSATTNAYTTTATVNGPKAIFTYTPTNVSPNSTVYFYNNSNTYNNYQSTFKWVFSDGTTSTASYPTRLYTKVGTDTVKLVAKNPVTGCTDTAIQVINVKNFNASFTYTSSYIDNNSCPPVVVRFTNTSVNARSVSWNFGDGGKADNQNNPSHTYYKPGVYYVTLYITGDNNSKDSTTDSITVKGPYAKIRADILQGCGSQIVTLTADVKNARSFDWDFADGTVIKQSKDTFAVHRYTTPGVYTPSMSLIDAGGCPGSSEMKDTIVIDTLNVNISYAPSRICDSAQVLFNPVVKSYASDKLRQPLKYNWNFGTANIADTSDGASPYFIFINRNKYAVQLTVTSPYGCVKQAIDTVEVFQRAKAIITGPSQICESTTATFNGSSDVNNVKWKWIFNNGSTSTVQNPANQLYNAPGTYDVQLVVDNAGCYDTAVSKLIVNPKPSINLTPRQPTVCLGKSIQLTAGGGVTYNWLNAPGLNSYTTSNPVASPGKTTKYNVEVTNSFGCKSSDSVTVNVASPFKISTLPDTSVCVGNSLQLKASGAASYTWINNTSGISNTQIANPVATPSINTTYTVVGYDAYQCFTDTASLKVTVASYPTVNAGADQQVFTGATVQLQTVTSTDVVKYNWSPLDYLSCVNCAAPISKPRNDISYIVTAINKYGCAATDTVSIKVLCDQSHVYIPTAFTPNGDFKNDGFYIKGGGVKMIKFLKIFNRSGEVIFEKINYNIDDPSSAWNGKYKGYDLPTGAYVYYTEMLCDTGQTFSFKGTVVLIR